MLLVAGGKGPCAESRHSKAALTFKAGMSSFDFNCGVCEPECGALRS